jgi:hypothetical protein
MSEMKRPRKTSESFWKKTTGKSLVRIYYQESVDND